MRAPFDFRRLVSSRRLSSDTVAHQGDAESQAFPHDLHASSDAASRFNPNWYLARYPDVAAAGLDPLGHYLEFGALEGRAASPADEFDAAWYVAHYPDVAAATLDPLTHYLEHGLQEGRAGHASDKTPTAYAVRSSTLAVEWADRFDARWYIARNADVAESGQDPFVHFLTQGILENRRPGPKVLLEHTPLTDERLECRKVPRNFNEVSLFVAHSPTGRLKANVPEYLRNLRANGISTILIVAADAVFEDLPQEVLDFVEGLYVRENVGYDFAAWAHVISGLPDVWRAETLYLMNDSMIGPTNTRAFAAVIETVRGSGADMLGLTENVDRGWHLQSYFLAFKRRALQSSTLQEFVANIVCLRRKDDVVNEYETRLAATLRAGGLRCEAIFPTPGKSNPTLYSWRELIECGAPFVKLSTIRQDIPTVYAGDWRNVLERAGYDSAVADRSLAEFWRWMPPAALGEAQEHIQRCQDLADFHEFIASREKIYLPCDERPEASIVFVASGAGAPALRHLRALATHASALSCEFLLVHDGSNDDLALLLQRTQGATVLENAGVFGYQRSVNRAIARARGDWLVILDNCSISLDELSTAINGTKQEGRVAAAFGGPVLSPDGVVNAGTIIWSSGEGAAFGVEHILSDHELAFGREVDALPACSIVVRRDLLEFVGRLDPAFENPDAAIADLCMTLRAAGHSINYNPRLVAKRQGLVSIGNWAERDRVLLEQKHRIRLMKEHCAPGTDLLTARNANRKSAHLLVVQDGDCVEDFPGARDWCDRLIAACHREGVAAGLVVTGGQVREDAESERSGVDVEAIGDSTLEDILLFRKGYYEGVLIDSPGLLARASIFLKYHPEHARGLRVIYYAAAGARLRYLAPLAATWPAGQPVEPEIVDLTIAGAVEQAALLVDAGFRNVQLLHHLDVRAPTPPSFNARRDFLVVGRFDDDECPHLTSLFLLVDEVLPWLDRKLAGGFRVNVVGVTGARRLLVLRDSRVVIHGAGGDLLAHLDAARVLILLNQGPDASIASQSRLRGLPVASFDLSKSQDGGAPYDCIDFADHCAHLYSDKGLWEAASAGYDGSGGVVEATVCRAALSIKRLLLPAAGGDDDPARVGSHRRESEATQMRDALARSPSQIARVRAPLPRRSATPHTASSRIAVVYLARGAEEDAAGAFERFRDSYCAYDAGIDHDLIVIFKGFADRLDEREVERLFARADAQILRLPDDGFDIGAYIRASRVLTNEYVCFLNTHSEILCDDWLRILAERFARTEVGMVGATGSFEVLEFFEGASTYPNIHLRSNAFMLSRRLFLEIAGDRTIVTKEDAYGVENGPTSLTRQVLSRGLEVLVVGRNGRSYPPQWWPSSDTFRQGRQDNLLVADNQTRWYETGDAATRQMLFSRAWGGYIDPQDLPAPIGEAIGGH